tara:strand:- start:4666 stop:5379 length:714 start_codon:yes stop_codon:yes gene_type:complete
MKNFLLVFSCVFGLYSCSKEKITSKLVQLSPFVEVEVNDTFTIELEEDSLFYIEVVGDEKLIDKVEYKIESEKLVLSNSKRFKWMQPTKNKTRIIIHSLPLSKVVASESCFITTNNPITSQEFGLVLGSKLNEAELELNCDVFYFWNNFPCGGTLELTGRTRDVKLWTDALFAVDARNLEASYGNIVNSSKGNIAVRVNDKLDYSIQNEGDINLYGNPTEIFEIEPSTSSGQLINQD